MGDTGFSDYRKNRRNSLEKIRGKVVSMQFFDRRGVDEEDSF